MPSSELTQILSHEPIYGRPPRRGLVAHVLPLSVVGVGLGWLAWRIRRGARQLDRSTSDSCSGDPPNGGVPADGPEGLPT